MLKVNELLPLLFKNGFRINAIGFNCGNCKKNIPSTQIHGIATELNEHCMAFTGKGYCYECRTITPVECRFSDDGSFLNKSKSGWKRGNITIDYLGTAFVVWRKLKAFACRLRNMSW
jgi:hypothetical protein